MDDVTKKLLTGLLAHVLTGVSGWLIANGILTQGDIAQLIAGLVAGGVTVGLVLYNRYKDHLTLLTALAAPVGTTLDQVKSDVKAGETPAVTTPSNVAPKVLALLLATALGGALASSCADAKAELVKFGNVATNTIGVAQAGEIALCLPKPTDLTVCTSALAAKVGYTSAKHQQAEGDLSKSAAGLDAFEVALANWQPHTPLPNPIADVLASIQDVLSLAQSLDQSNPKVQALVTGVQAVVTLVQGVIANYGVSATSVTPDDAARFPAFFAPASR
jgi:hypothetical protein